jgi:hypothetical protein
MTMKALAILIAGLAAGTCLAGTSAGLPHGNYVGTADWKGPRGSSGTYTVEKSFDGDRIAATYRWTDETAREEKHTITLAAKPGEAVFDVVDEKGASVGRAYCYDDACSYRATFGPVTIDESFRWSGDAMVVLGAKSGPGFSVVWKESLKLR